MPMLRVAASALVLVFGWYISPTAGQDASPHVFRASTDLVQLHVNVFDGNSDAVPSLKKEHFLVFEDGRHQEIRFFSSEDVPVAVGLVVDASSSMITKHQRVVSGGMAFVESSHPEDEVFIVPFNERVRFALPAGLAFTSSRPLLHSVLSRLRPGGKTALYDAVMAALDHVQRAVHQKHVIIVLSDGDDNASSHERREMFERARQSDAIIYTVALNSPGTGERSDPGLLRRLAEMGGGASYFPRNEEQTVAAFTEIATNIRRGYSIGYVPSNPGRDGGWRSVKVMVRVPGKKLQARCRDGYVAAGSSGTN